MQQKSPLFTGCTVSFLSTARRFLFLISMMLWVIVPLFSQITWDGSESADWNNPGNWSTNTLPGTNDFVTIPGSTPNNPTLSTAGPTVKTVTIQSGAVLTITATGTLGAENGPSRGILNQGTVNNSGIITIGATVTPSQHGIRNQATFNNNPGGQIYIDRTNGSGSYALYNESGTFTNEGTITIGGVSNVGDNGLRNNSTFNNNGQITIDRANTTLLINNGPFNNQGDITLGATQNSSSYGLQNNNVFNNTSGTISIDRALTAALHNQIGTFTNQASITIGSIAGVGQYGLQNAAIFNNNIGGQISIERSTNSGLYCSGSTFNNAANITIGATQTVGIYGLNSRGTFNNNTGGQIMIDRSSTCGVFNDVNSSFTNQATITIGSVANVGNYGLQNSATFNNNSGQINIDRVATSAVYCTGGTFTNQAGIIIGALNPVGTLLAGNANTFFNSTGGLLKGSGGISASSFNSSGGTLAPGNSPGIMTFSSSEGFSNNTLLIEVNGTGVVGTNYDQVVVNGTATLAGTLALSINYTPANGDQVTIVNALSLSGTFASVTGLPSGWTVNYNSPSSGLVTLLYTVLPVEMRDLTARLLDQTVQLNWLTASEHNNRGFYVERSGDGLRWTELGFVAGKGTATEAQNYGFSDKSPLSAINYYRLRQTDYNGRETLSKVVNIAVTSPTNVMAHLRVYPNPVYGELNLLLPENTEEEFTVQLFSPAGQPVRGITLRKGINLLDISTLTAGVYTLQILSAQERSFKKIVVQQ